MEHHYSRPSIACGLRKIKSEGKMGIVIGVIVGGGLGLAFTDGGLVGLVVGAVVGGFVGWLYSHGFGNQ